MGWGGGDYGGARGAVEHQARTGDSTRTGEFCNSSMQPGVLRSRATAGPLDQPTSIITMHASSCFSFLRPALAGAFFACSVLGLAAGAPAGAVDFGAIPGPSGHGEQVEVHVPRHLVSIAAKIVAEHEPEVAKLLEGIEAVHVRVVSLDDGNRAAVQARVGEVRADLARGGWHQVVAVRDGAEDVAVYLRTSDDETIAGVVVMVLNDRAEAVFLNVVGAVRPEQIARIAAALPVPRLAEIAAHCGR